ncbi:hypothetical protein FXO37_16616 [Capsicum annuum]|nr:hypothetical protein FXO37_16616 [Capsicum annuum]
MGKLVSNHQNAFINDKQITDVTLITNEVLDWRIKSKEPGILCKLDIEKAFDQLNWSYLFSILRQMGFGERWIKWIKFNITTVKYSVLVNGNGFNVGTRNTVNVSHLLYADETLVFCGANRSQVLYLNLTLLIFESLSGLHINMLKSVIFPVNEVSDLEELAGILGCNIGSLPTTYLGLSLGAAFGSTSIWDGVIEKFEKKLASWQMQYLSMGGILTLINSVLDSISTYYMTRFPIPSKILKQLDRIRRDFLWEGNNKDHKFHLVKWIKVVRPKQMGGLDIKDLALHNKCLLMKWIWRYIQVDQALWKEVIKAKHGVENHWCSKLSNSPHGKKKGKKKRDLVKEGGKDYQLPPAILFLQCHVYLAEGLTMMLAALRNERQMYVSTGPFNTEHERFVQHFELLLKACLPDHVSYYSFVETTAHAHLSNTAMYNCFKGAQRIAKELRSSFSNDPDKMAELRRIEQVAEHNSVALGLISRLGAVDASLKVQFEFSHHPFFATAVVKRS